MSRPVPEIAVQLRRTRNAMLHRAGEVRRHAEVEAAHCVREAEWIDQELSRLGLEPGPGSFLPVMPGPEDAA